MSKSLGAAERRDLAALLAFASVSADPAHHGEVRAAAEWLRARCTTAGLEHARLLETPGRPSVYADWLHAPGKPTVLIYGHYDVQPVPDPSAWATNPFEPHFLDDCVFARGASDMKCQLLAVVHALEQRLREGASLPLNVRVLLEGEEEILSPNLAALLHEHSRELACDLAVSPDGSQPESGAPRLGLGSRGLCDLELTVTAAAHDLHSGIYGGAVPNAARALAALIAGLHDEDGQIAVDGFYDGAEMPSQAARADARAGEWDEAAEAAAIGVTQWWGEPEWSPWERTTQRPTIEVNGISAGYTGPGLMTVLPSQAHAKLSCRLVPGQDPETARSRVVVHLERHLPPGVRLLAEPGSASVPAYRYPRDHPATAVAAGVIERLIGTTPVLALEGGTLPVQAYLLRELGVHTLVFGFSGDGERAHGVDEFQRLDRYFLTREAYGLLLEGLAAR